MSEARELYQHNEPRETVRPKTSLHLVKNDDRVDREEVDTRKLITEYVSGNRSEEDRKRELKQRNDAIAARMADARRKTRKEIIQRKLTGLRGSLEPVTSIARPGKEKKMASELRLPANIDEDEENYGLEKLSRGLGPMQHKGNEIKTDPLSGLGDTLLETEFYRKGDRESKIRDRTGAAYAREAAEGESQIQAGARERKAEEQKRKETARTYARDLKMAMEKTKEGTGKTEEKTGVGVSKRQSDEGFSPKEADWFDQTGQAPETQPTARGEKAVEKSGLLRDALTAREKIMDIRFGGVFGLFKKELKNFFEPAIDENLSEEALKAFIKNNPFKGLRPKGITFEELGKKIKDVRDRAVFDDYIEILKTYQHSLSEERF